MHDERRIRGLFRPLTLRAPATGVVTVALLFAGLVFGELPLTAPEALAQDTGDPPRDKEPGLRRPGRRKPGRSRVRFGDLGDDERDDGGDVGGGDDAPELPKRNEPELLVRQLAEWPSADARQASIRLAAQPSVALPLLERTMLERGHDWRMISGAAATLGRIGDLRALELIESKIQDRKMFQHASELLNALVKIDPIGAKARLTAHLLHPASAVVEEAGERLKKRVDAADLDGLREIFEIGGTAARAASLELMREADAENARADFAAALRDKHPTVCFAAAQSLSADDSDEALAMLRRAAISPLDRQMGYAFVGISMRAERTGQYLLRPSDVRALLGGRGLDHLERLNRAAAALALADAGYFHEVESLESALDKRVLPGLLDAYVDPEFWPDMKVLGPLIVTRLRRLSGNYSLGGAREWATWWQQHSGGFEAHRVLAGVPAEAAGQMVLSIGGDDAPGGETTVMAASGSALRSVLPGDLSIVIDASEAATLARLLNDSGVLRDAERGTRGAPRRAPLQVGVRTGNRERRIGLYVDELGDSGDELIATVAALRARHGWQRYRPSAVDPDAFVEAMSPAFSAEREPAEREAALAALIIDSLDMARGDDFLISSLNRLTEMADLGGAIQNRHTDRLLALLGLRDDADDVARGIVRVLASSRKPEAQPLLIDFVLSRPSVHRDELLLLVYQSASDEQLVAGLKHERHEVRVAATASLRAGVLKGDGATAAFAKLEDSHEDVRAEAVRALGRLRVEEARTQLQELAGQPGELRIPAIDALGHLGGKQALPVIMGAFASDLPRLRVAAIDAFAECGEPEGLSAIVFAMSGDPSALVREVASSAIRRVGTRRAADALRQLAVDPAQPEGPRARALTSLAQLRGSEASEDLRRMVDDPSALVGDAAALALADWRDEGSVPRLLEMLRKGRRTTRVVRALESLSLETFNQSDTDLLASLYEGWWELSGDRGPRGWLADALRAEDIQHEILDDWEAGRAGREAIPVLLEGLASERWSVRRACDLALRDLTGRNVGDQEPWTSDREARRMASAWKRVVTELRGER